MMQMAMNGIAVMWLCMAIWFPDKQLHGAVLIANLWLIAAIIVGAIRRGKR